MKLSKWMIAVLLALVALVALPGVAYASSDALPALDEVVFGHDYTLPSGRAIDGDLVVLGGNLTMEQGSRVTGQVAVIGGDATISGHVQGDLVVVGGAAYLQPSSIVDGDLVVPTGGIVAEPGSQVLGNQVSDFNFPWGEEWNRNPGRITTVPNEVMRTGGRGWGGDFVWLVFRSVGMATVALLLVLFMQPYMKRVADTLTAQPPLAAGVGLLSIVAAGAATVMLAVTLLLIPVAALIPFVLVVAWGFGWISLGLEVGRRLSQGFQAVWSPALQAALGTFTLTFAIGVVSWIPCLGWILGVVVGLAGLGAVVLTRFGSQQYPDPARVVVAPPALPAPRKRASAKTATAKTVAAKKTPRKTARS